MNKTDWLTCTDPRPMLNFLSNRMSERKLKLFTVACCRRLPVLTEEAQKAIEVIEADANGQVDAIAYDRVSNLLLGDAIDPYSSATLGGVVNTCMLGILHDSWEQAAQKAVGLAIRSASWEDVVKASPNQVMFNSFNNFSTDARTTELAILAELLRDISGDPFQPLISTPVSFTAETRLMAQEIYEKQAFNRFPLLANALEASGCNDTSILTHCHQIKMHVQGCWVLDLILGKH